MQSNYIISLRWALFGVSISFQCQTNKNTTRWQQRRWRAHLSAITVSTTDYWKYYLQIGLHHQWFSYQDVFTLIKKPVFHVLKHLVCIQRTKSKETHQATKRTVLFLCEEMYPNLLTTRPSLLKLSSSRRAHSEKLWHQCLHSFCSLSYDTSIASSKVNFPNSVI